MSEAVRDEIVLPFDSAAESVLINYGQTYPERITDLGLAPADFYNMKHRRIWQAMVTLRLEQPQVVDPGAFYLQLSEYLASDRGRDPRSTLNSVDASADWTTRACAPHAPVHDVQYFIGQIKRCVEARSLIDAAQQIAERAYRVPEERFGVTDASVVLSRVAGVPVKEELGWTLPV